MSRVLVDTNIFIYALINTSSFHHQAASLLQNNSIELFTASKNISEYFAVCTKLGVSKEVIWNFYRDILHNTTILFPHEESLSRFEFLLERYQPVGNRVYDMEIVSIMLAHSITEIATVNTKDFELIKEISLFAL